MRGKMIGRREARKGWCCESCNGRYDKTWRRLSNKRDRAAGKRAVRD